MPIVGRSEELDQIYTDLASILTRTDVALSAFRDALRGAGVRDLTTLETDIEALLARADIATSALRDGLRDGLRGTGIRDFTTLETDVEALLARADIATSALRDALRGAGTRDLTTLETDIETQNTMMASRGSWGHGHITVVTAGMPVQGPNVAAAPGKAFAIVYHPSFAGSIGIGNSSAAALLTTGTPIILSAVGQALSLFVTNLNLLWFDASTNGGRIMWAVET